MKMLCVESTSDGRLTAYKIYSGQIAYTDHQGSVFLCYDNNNKWTTFKLNFFKPVDAK